VRCRGRRGGSVAPRTRLDTHLDVNANHIDRAVDAFAGFFSARA